MVIIFQSHSTFLLHFFFFWICSFLLSAMDPFRLFPALDPIRLSACSIRRAAGHCSIRVRAAPPGHASPSLVSPCLLPKLALISFAQVSPPVSSLASCSWCFLACGQEVLAVSPVPSFSLYSRTLHSLCFAGI